MELEHKIRLYTPKHMVNFCVKDLPVLLDKEYELQPFDQRVLFFFDALSKKILKNDIIRRLPDIAALAFWLRKTNLTHIKEENTRLFDNPQWCVKPVGKVFHICPANVDTMFVYSLVVSLLMGNKNILKISSRIESPHISIVFELLNELISESCNNFLTRYINIISYKHNDDISNFLSTESNVRIIWGGDSTITTFKKFSSAPRTKDIVFADRVSVFVTDCNSIINLSSEEKEKFVKKIFNDAYTFDQMGCSSPQTMYFVGEESEYQTSKQIISNLMSTYLANNYKTDINSLASLKFNTMVNDSIERFISSKTGDNYFTFVELRDEYRNNLLHSCGGGYFYCSRVNKLEDLTILKQSKVQTVTYFSTKKNFANDLSKISIGEGTDRIVPLGEALNFHYIWDGYNLLDELSRKVFIK